MICTGEEVAMDEVSTDATFYQHVLTRVTEMCANNGSQPQVFRGVACHVLINILIATRVKIVM